MGADAASKELQLQRATEATRQRPPGLRAGDIRTLICSLAWGAGDVLLTTSATHRFKELHPDTAIMFHTRKYSRSQRYTSPFNRGAPGEMIENNPDIAYIMDWGETPNVDWEPVAAVPMKYAEFGGDSLDYPIQAHYYECLGLDWTPGQRFDAVYNVTPEEREWARAKLPESGGPYLVLTPHTDWPGKAWRKEAWMELAIWADSQGLHPVIMAGQRMPQFSRRGTINMAGDLTWRQNGAILERSDLMVATEGGLSNLRAAVGGKQVLLTCATQVGVAIWMPPETTTELRFWYDPAKEGRELPYTASGRSGPQGDEAAGCKSCMWRGQHVIRNDPRVPPASIKQCPSGRSLRDLPVSVVAETLLANSQGAAR